VRLIHGDCLVEMGAIADGSIDLILADLPYGTTACKWDTVIPFEPLWKHYKRIIKRNGAIVLTASQPFTSALVMSNPYWFRHADVWRKSRATGHLKANRRPMRAHEDIIVFSPSSFTFNPQMRRGKPNHVGSSARQKGGGVYRLARPVFERKTTAKFPISVVEIDSVSPTGRLHQTQKPVALMEYLIRTYTNEGETVLDNTMGSGTTGIACLNTNRNFIGIEKDAEIFATAELRIAAAESKQSELLIA